MFERFTDQARRVVVIAQEDARQLNHGYIGTEHILLGLLRPETGVPAEILAGLGVTPERVRAEIMATEGQGYKAPSGHIPFTPSAKKILERSLAESLRLQHKTIGTEHLLLGLARGEDESTTESHAGRRGWSAEPHTGPGASATEILAALGVSTEDVVRQTKQRLASPSYSTEDQSSPAWSTDTGPTSVDPALEARLSTIEAAVAGIVERLAALERRRAE